MSIGVWIIIGECVLIGSILVGGLMLWAAVDWYYGPEGPSQTEVNPGEQEPPTLTHTHM